MSAGFLGEQQRILSRRSPPSSELLKELTEGRKREPILGNFLFIYIPKFKLKRKVIYRKLTLNLVFLL